MHVLFTDFRFLWLALCYGSLETLTVFVYVHNGLLCWVYLFKSVHPHMVDQGTPQRTIAQIWQVNKIPFCLIFINCDEISMQQLFPMHLHRCPTFFVVV